MTNKPALVEQSKKFGAYLEKSKSQIAMALPRHMTPERMYRIAMTTIRRTPDLLKCDFAELGGVVLQCAQIGLEPDGMLGRAYILPYNNRKRGCIEPQLIIGYKGYIELMRRSGEVDSLFHGIVYENEKFTIDEANNVLNHEKLPPSKRGEEVIGGYAGAWLKSGGRQFIWLWEDDFIAAKNSSAAGKKNFGPWVDHPEDMRIKTCYRRLAKFMPLSSEITRATSFEDTQDVHGSRAFNLDLEINPETIIDVEAMESEEAAEQNEEKTDDLANRVKDM